MKKKFLKIGALFCACVAGLSMTACSNNAQSNGSTSFVTLDINPSIEITLDKNNVVTSVHGANEDAQILLYNEDGIVGAKVDVAVEKITSLAIDLGYLDENNKVVGTCVSSADSKHADSILKNINAKVTATAQKLDLAVTTTADKAYSLLRELEQLKKEYPDSKDIQSLTPEKFRLVVSASSTGEISVEAAAQLDYSELIEKAAAANEKIESYASTAYYQLKTKAENTYDEAVGAVIDSVYTTYYTKNLLSHPNTFYYGAAYQSYATAGRSLNALANQLTYIEGLNERPLSEEQISAVAKVLNVENTDVLKNADGEITIDSIYTYADKTFKNSEASAQLEELKTKLSSALDSVELEIAKEFDEETKEYSTQIDVVIGSYTTISASLSLTLENPFISKEAKDRLQTIYNEILEMKDEITAITEDGKITSDELRAVAKKMEEKKAQILAKIEADLSQDELEEIQAQKDTIMKSLTDAKETMQQAIAQAEEEAKTRLQQLKDIRRAQN